jgi:hypothetical protein
MVPTWPAVFYRSRFSPPSAGPAVVISILNILLVAGVRYLDMRMRDKQRRYEIEVRSKERLELERLRVELEVAHSAALPESK